jgi:hypothetical protein
MAAKALADKAFRKAKVFNFDSIVGLPLQLKIAGR